MTREDREYSFVLDGTHLDWSSVKVPKTLAEEEEDKLIDRSQVEQEALSRVENAGIIFLDEIHSLIGTGSAEGSLDAANIIKPALSRGEIQSQMWNANSLPSLPQRAISVCNAGSHQT